MSEKTRSKGLRAFVVLFLLALICAVIYIVFVLGDSQPIS